MARRGFIHFILRRFLGVRLDVRPAPRQKRMALVIAILADLTQLALAPLFVEGVVSPLDGALDLIVAGLLLFTLGWNWRTVLALGLELVPGLALFPSWTAAIATLPTARDAAAESVAAVPSSLSLRSAWPYSRHITPTS